MKQYIIDLQSFRVDANSLQEAVRKAECMLILGNIQVIVEAAEEVDDV
jgi:hypothetical protein